MLRDNSISDLCKEVLQDFVLKNKNVVYLDFSSNLIGYKLETFLNETISDNWKLYKQSKVPKYLFKLRVFNSIRWSWITLKEALPQQKDQTIR